MSQLSPSEKRGLLVLFAIMLVGFTIQWLQPHFVKADLYDYSVQDSIFKLISADTTWDPQRSRAEESAGEKKHTRAKVKELLPNSININTANQKELEKLPRIGPSTAKNILEYREKNGSFKSIDELDKVKRIGPKTLDLIRPYLTIK